MSWCRRLLRALFCRPDPRSHLELSGLHFFLPDSSDPYSSDPYSSDPFS